MTGGDLPRFSREFLDSGEPLTVIGEGSLGGKAQGLAGIRDVLSRELHEEDFPGVEVAIPTLAVIATDSFDEFIAQNRLADMAEGDLPDHRIARAFQQASLPIELVGDLQAMISKVHSPLAVRSSSRLEDAMYRPFAGVYATKMIPNNQYDVDTRFRKLIEAVKFVYASTYFSAARNYIKATDRTIREEKMAVIIQEVVGRRHADRFYPDVSGVARSYNFYPTGHAEAKDGVVSLALGLGKTIVDGGRAWSYSPAYPRANPPYNTIRDLLKQTQTDFWAVNMGKPPEYDPINEAEYLIRPGLEEAEEDEVLGVMASTYDAESDRLMSGMSAPGPRVLTFAPLLVHERVPLNRAVRALLSSCEAALGVEVEIEFAVTFGEGYGDPARLGFLQVRPLVVPGEKVDLPSEMLRGPQVLTASETALGNGVVETIQDVVYLRPETFDAHFTQEMASELEALNRELTASNRPYLLMGFGRWGTSDPWLGVPVDWGQISGARAIVESSLPDVQADPSQGSHFFHNVTSLRVLYFWVRHTGPYPIEWEWLQKQEAAKETRFIRHVRLSSPLRVVVDGHSGRGVILHT